MKLRKVQMLVAFGVLAVMSGGASLAWACSPQPDALKLSANSGGVGDTVEVTGSRFDGRVEVRWNAIDGPVLGRSSSSNFTMSVAVPPVPKGVYSITAIVRNEDGTIKQRQTIAFEVDRSDVIAQEPAIPPPGADPVTPPPDGDPVTPPPGADPVTPPPDDDPVTAPPGPGETVTGPAPSTPADPIGPGAEAPAPEPRVAADPSPAPAPSPDVAPSTPERRPVAPTPAAALTPTPASDPAPVAIDADASAPTVSGDLWSGFTSGPGSLTGAEAFGTETPSTDDTGMKAGVGLLVAGLVALGLAGGAAAVTRRRATVAVSDHDESGDI